MVWVGLSSLYRIPRQQIVLPKAEETIKDKSNSDHAQKKRMSAIEAALIFCKSFFRSFLIIFWRNIALLIWPAKNTTGTE